MRCGREDRERQTDDALRRANESCKCPNKRASLVNPYWDGSGGRDVGGGDDVAVGNASCPSAGRGRN